MTKTLLYILLFTSKGCKQFRQNEKYSTEGDFAYYIQRGHFKEGEIESMGVCSKERFLTELQEFDWEEQLVMANNKGEVSPTISVRHNVSKREMRISIAGNDVKTSAYWIFYGNSENMNHLVSLDLESTFPLVEKFFDLDFDYLDDGFEN